MNAAMRALVTALVAGPALSVVTGSTVLRRNAAQLRIDADVAATAGPQASALEQRLASNVSATEGDLTLVAAAKPIRINRGGVAPPLEKEKPTIPSHLHCGVTTKAHSGSSKQDACPEECPFFAQDRTDSDWCTFVCVREEECRLKFNETPIGDKRLGVCRSCMVDGCQKCDASVTFDRCAECQAGYNLVDGQCHFKYGGQWVNVVGAIIAVILALVVIWVLDMVIRPCTNEPGLEYAETERDDKKLRQHKDDHGERKLWPLTTNLTKTQVAGPGMILHFNFQVALIVWAFVIGATWVSFCALTDPALWVLGTRKFGTPRDNCILVAWGRATMVRLNWVKVSFLWIVWAFSIVFWFLYGIYQLRTFQETDFQNKTMKDFVAMVVGLPPISGEKAVEEDLKTKIESLTGQSVIGVSVAWNYMEVEEDISKALEEELDEADPPPEPIAPPAMNPIRQQLYNAEKAIFATEPETRSTEVSSDIESERSELQEVLLAMRTSPRAFAVFETQEAMEDAVEKLAGGFEFEGADGVILEMIDAEPATVQWVNFGHSSNSEKVIKLTAGFGIIGLACLFWAIIFYAPYAYYVMTFNYENGRQPGFIVGFSFSMIVVIGNAIMYEVCARISDWVGFRFKDNREACYMMLYTIACMFNVGLDFCTTYFTAELIMEGLGFRTWYGKPLKEVTEFTAKFETYGMQRILAENSYNYAFPSTFLIPFLIEPFPSIFVPLWIGKLIVRSHPELQGRFAETWLAMADMELGRYADLLLNALLGILIFYFPGGYTWKLFFGMAASHCYIYIFDHYKVLRQIPTCTFASFDIEWWAQAIMAPIIGVIFASLAFKENCHTGFYCVTGPSIVLICFLAWLLSTALQLCLLVFVIPKFGKNAPDEDHAAHVTFSELASKVPCSWFTSNPVNCLRSKHFYKHSPPCSYYVMGKEDLMAMNKDIGCFYEETSKTK